MPQNEKISFRLLQKEDFPIIFEWINNPKVMPFWYGKDKPHSFSWIEKHFGEMLDGKGQSTCWIIKVDNKPIGFMYNTPYFDDEGEFFGRVEIDILIGDPNEWGKGYGAEALKMMIKYCFGKQKAERVFIIPRISNARAIHIYEKVGFKKEGILRHYEKFEGDWTDCVMMSILRKEYDSKS